MAFVNQEGQFLNSSVVKLSHLLNIPCTPEVKVAASRKSGYRESEGNSCYIEHKNLFDSGLQVTEDKLFYCKQ